MTLYSPSKRSAALFWLMLGAFVVRAFAAVVVERLARSKGTLCLFEDTKIYWQLADAIRLGAPFEVSQYGIAHRALRTPGYPLFLAACQVVFGAANTLAPRLVQGALGAVCVLLMDQCVRTLWPEERSRRIALAAAMLAAFEPYWVAASPLLLSEAVFVPLMLATLAGVARLWRGCSSKYATMIAFGSGLAAGSAVLVRPSWALAVPLLLAAWVGLDRSWRSLRNAAMLALGTAAIMMPWWVRNAEVFGRFVPTAVWSGASFYDGLNPSADGSSDMKFLGDPVFRSLGEVEQDRALAAAAWRFVREHPGKTMRLAAVKAGRFWSPWPNAAILQRPWTTAAGAIFVLPVYLLILVGIWRCRHDARALVLLAGPLLYFCGLHAIFVGSVRYRVPAEVPAFGLAAVGLFRPRGDDRTP